MGMGRYLVLKRDLRCPELDDVLDRVVSEEGWVGHNTLLLILAVEGADSLSAAKIDEAMWGLARVLENVGEQRGNEAVEELLRGRNTQLGVQDHASVGELFSDSVVPLVESVV